MDLAVDVMIKGSKEDVWKVITDIENAPKTITGIEEIEILERPAEGLVGLKWRETRTLFGRTATEDIWITNVKENEMYKTRAENQGAVYISSFTISEQDGKSHLTMEFDGTAQTLGAKVLGAIMGVFFKGPTRKAMEQDLVDIKAAVEGTG